MIGNTRVKYMDIQFAILGLLNRQSLSGYDLKKIIADSASLYWSGNNNQIYSTLIQLNQEGLVTYKVVSQIEVPSKKVYSITQLGFDELKKWLISPIDPPELHSTFLVRLTWADLLNKEELNFLLDEYEEEVRVQSLMIKEKIRRGTENEDQNSQAVRFSRLVSQNLISFYENELSWLRSLRQNLESPG